MYGKFKEESEGREQDTVMRLMNYYQVPYMAVLIRCYELGLPDTDSILEELMNVSADVIRTRFAELWLDGGILTETLKDDYMHIEEIVQHFGRECIRDSYIEERTLHKVLQNMRTLYLNIKEG